MTKEETYETDFVRKLFGGLFENIADVCSRIWEWFIYFYVISIAEK